MAGAWLEAALQAAGGGAFEWLIPDDRLRGTPELAALLGFDGGRLPASGSEWLARLEPEDAARVRKEFEVAWGERRREFVAEYRVVCAGGGRWLGLQAACEYDRHGGPARLLGLVTDIDARKRKELRSEFVLQLALTLRPLSDPRAIASHTMQMVREHLQVDRCVYARVESDEETFELLGSSAAGLPPIAGKSRLSDFGVEVAQSQREGRPHLIEDTLAAGLAESARAQFAAWGVRAGVAVPLLKEGRLRAGVAVHHSRPRRWTFEEVELVELAANACWESIERAQTANRLEASERRLRLALTAARMVAWEVDAATGKAEVLDNAAEVFGLKENASLADTEAGFALVHPDDEAAHRARFMRTMTEGGSHVTQFRMLRQDGAEVLWIEERAYALCDDAGKPTRLFGVMIDITERKKADDELRAAHALLADKAAHLELLVKQRTAHLQEIIGELESFSYSVAHDLRSPLRSLASFAHILLEEHAAGLNDEGRSHLQRIANAAARMDGLTRDVLNYSAVVRASAWLEPVDVAALVSDLLETYPALSATLADVTVRDPLPAVVGNTALLTQVFSNLLQNAVKFVAPGVRPVVTISAIGRGGRVRFEIQDNGVGIPAAYQQKIFGMFERLHTAYEGTGIGLAIVKKAVERMHGSLGVMSNGAGSTFWFELPASEAAPPADPSRSHA